MFQNDILCFTNHAISDCNVVGLNCVGSTFVLILYQSKIEDTYMSRIPFSVKMPKTLRQQLRDTAKMQGISQGKVVKKALAAYLDSQSLQS